MENVNKSFGSNYVVKNLSVRCPEQTIYGFLGPNGAGKTTTLRMIMSILCPDSGNILICSRNFQQVSREKIGYLPEERGLYQKMTVQGILSYIAAIKGVKRKLSHEVVRWMDTFGLIGLEKHKVEELSKGMQQKLQFITTVINEPDILIFDEPFSGLDPINVELIANIMIRLKKSGKTIIYSTHVMEQAEKLCDFILLLDKGEKIFDGPYEQLKSYYKNNIIYLKLDGDASFLNRLPIIKIIEQSDGEVKVKLNKNVEPQELLAKLSSKVKIKGFEIKSPALHEIFIDMVGNNNVQNY